MLRFEVAREGAAYRFRLSGRADTFAFSFRVVADLCDRLVGMIEEGQEGAGWAFEYRQHDGTLEELLTLASVECHGRGAYREGLRAFVARLLTEPDVDDPCFSDVVYRMDVEN